ncbi:MAG: pentapeptide MXKDX repeat protein [Bradyrhizobium sp.]
MTIGIRIAAGISATAFSLSLVVAPAAFAGDPMKQDIDFKNGVSGDDGVKKGTTKDPIKKDDRMKKYGLSK